MTGSLWRSALVLGVAVFSSCGYHVGGKADLVPKSIQTISIPRFSTTTMQYKLVDSLPQAIGREFLARTRFRLVNDPSVADAVLNGGIIAAGASTAIFDPTSGKATSVQVWVSLNIALVERATGRTLFSRPSLVFRQNYQVPADPHQFFDESGPAFDRLNRDLAHDVVSAIVEDF